METDKPDGSQPEPAKPIPEPIEPQPVTPEPATREPFALLTAPQPPPPPVEPPAPTPASVGNALPKDASKRQKHSGVWLAVGVVILLLVGLFFWLHARHSATKE